jgi:hypothetical protein
MVQANHSTMLQKIPKAVFFREGTWTGFSSTLMEKILKINELQRHLLFLEKRLQLQIPLLVRGGACVVT